MNPPIILIGVGEMGGVFARGLLRAGWPLIPQGRHDDLAATAATCPSPAAVVVAVAEQDMASVLESLPTAWRDRLVLLQNELLPRDWESRDLQEVTVISVWFEKKPGREFKVIIASPVYGPRASLIHDALTTLGIPVTILDRYDELVFELVCKNLYILTTNIAGLVVGGDVQTLWRDHRPLARAVAGEVLALQAWLTGRALDTEALIAGMVRAFEGDPQHQCLGRSAPARLARALEIAQQAGIAVPVLAGIQARPASSS